MLQQNSVSEDIRQRTSLRLRLLPVAVALIVATTMIPTALRRPSLSYLDTQIQLFDILQNIALYLPFGFTLNRSPWKALGAGFLLSSAAEIFQFACVNRDPSMLDVASNTTGAFLGALLASGWKRVSEVQFRALRISRLAGAICVLLAIGGFVALLGRSPKADFSNWDSSFQLAAGDELTGGRPWNGHISALFIYPESFTPDQLLALSTDGPQALSLPGSHSFPPPLYQASGPQNPLENLAAMRGRSLLAPREQQIFFDRLYRANQLTVLVWLRPDNLKQSGPARIVTYSQDPFNRNFTLGQSYAALVFRLRTPITGLNGSDPELLSRPILSTQHDSFVAAIFDGTDSQLFANGRLVGRLHLTSQHPHLSRRVAARFSPLFSAREVELTLGEIFIGAFLALGLLALYNPVQRTASWWVIAFSAGFVPAIALSFLTHSSIGYTSRIVILCVAGALTAALSLE